MTTIKIRLGILWLLQIIDGLNAICNLISVVLVLTHISETITSHLVQFVSIFSTAVCFQMSPQIACIRGCIVTLVAFVWLFSTVRHQMFLQIGCLRGCIITLVAFVWLFSTVRLQMCSQMACLRRCKVTLVAFVWLFSTVRFQMCPQIVCKRRCKITLVAFV